jgi:3-hydroxyacyl-[acyl-carrier-protein] dehydratase
MTGLAQDILPRILGGSASPLAAEPLITQRHGNQMSAVYTVQATEPVLAGHFPGFPIFPGVCLIECAHKMAAQVLADASGQTPAAGLTVIERARFLRPVFPGDEIIAEVTVAPVADGWLCTAGLRVHPAGAEAPIDVATFRLRYGKAAPPEEEPAAQDPGSSGVNGAWSADLGIRDIKRLLPHRYPMLLIDRVTGISAGRSLEAIKAVTANEPWYAPLGDDSGDAYPPVLLAESWCQAAGVLACLDQPNPDVRSSRVTLFGAITDLRFYRPVRPGDLLRHKVRLVRLASDVAVLEGESLVGADTVLRVGTIIIALRPPDAVAARPVASPGPATD